VLRGLVIYRLPAVVYAALLFWASSRSRLPLPNFGLGFEDKLAHFAAFAILSVLVYVALTRPSRIAQKPHGWAVALASLYALTDELHQRAVPGRLFEWTDLVSDVAGILVAQWLISRWEHRPDPADRANPPLQSS
jgi:VanZ family protein